MEKSSKKILITGISGFIGKNLIKKLLKEDYIIYGIVKNRKEIKKIKKYIKLLDSKRILKIDITNFKRLSRALRRIKPKYIIHLAALADPSRDIKNLEETFENNVIGTLNLLVASKDINYDKFINISTAEVYSSHKVPFKEGMKPNPVSPYSASKICSETYCNLFSRTYNKPITTLRFFLIYGPNQNTNTFIHAIINNALKNKDIIMTKGEQKREFTYVNDAVDAIIKTLKNKKSNFEIINIGSGKQHKLIDVAENVIKLTKSKSKIITSLPYRKNELMEYQADTKKAFKLLKWRTKTSLEKGLIKTIEVYRNRK